MAPEPGDRCIIGFSDENERFPFIINFINDYANENNTLFFLEALFPTIAIKNKLNYKTPIEFDKIYYRHDFTGEQFNINNFYHPLKDLNEHNSFRNY